MFNQVYGLENLAALLKSYHSHLLAKGHGKFESLGALGISCMLLGTAGGIAWHAIHVLQVKSSNFSYLQFVLYCNF